MSTRTPTLVIDLALVGAAFEAAPMTEAARILRELAAGLEDGSKVPEVRQRRPLREANGNTCGGVQLEMRRSD